MNVQGLEVKVTKVAQSTQLNQFGNPEQVIVVTYNVGPHGPFTETFPKAGFTQAAAVAKIQETAAYVAGLG